VFDPDTLTIGVSRPSLDLAMDRLNRAVADLLGRDVNRFQHMLRQVAESRERWFAVVAAMFVKDSFRRSRYVDRPVLRI
jgi:hypothetical protein